MLTAASREGSRGWSAGGRAGHSPAALPGRHPPEPDATEPEDRREAGSRGLLAPGRGRGRKMPVRRGHVAPQNTYLDTIIRKFEGQSEWCAVGGKGHDLEPWFGGRSGRTLY